MVEGASAGYKLARDARWRGECVVDDRVNYENWTGKCELLIRIKQELYIPGDNADSRDATNVFQFPVKDGDWKSQAPSLNRYVQKRYRKKGVDL